MTSTGPRLLFLVFFLIPTASRAQTAFVQAGYGVEARRFSRPAGADSVLDANSATVTAAAGAFLTPRFSASLELDFGATSSTAETTSFALAGGPSTITTTYATRQRSAAALAGFHTEATRRARIGVYVGLDFLSFRQEISQDAPPIVLSVPPPPTVYIDRTVTPAVGLDVSVRLVPGIDLVGSVRAHGIPLANIDGFRVRPAALLRVTF